MSIKETLRKAAEVFVDMPDAEPEEEGTASAAEPSPAATDPMADIDRRLAAMDARLNGGPEAAVAAPVAPAPAPAAPMSAFAAEGGLDMSALYAQAGVPAAPFPAEQALEMIHSLPAGLAPDVKKQTIQVTVAAMGKAIGATPESVGADAAAKRDALAAYAQSVYAQAAEFARGAQFEIAELERQIEAKRAAIRDADAAQSQVKRLCDAEAARLGEVLTYFGAPAAAAPTAPEEGTAPAA